MLRLNLLTSFVAVAVAAVTVRPATVRAQYKLVEELRIGESGDPIQLTRIGRVAARGDGGSYVAQPAECQVLVLDAGGTVLHRIGRCGGGPGEFRQITDLGLLDDTLWVWDQESSRVSYFPPGARLPTRTVRLDVSTALVPGLGLPSLQSILPDGSMHLYAPASSRNLPASNIGPRDRVIRIDRVGVGRDTLWLASSGRHVEVEMQNGRGGRIYMRPLFPDSPELRVSSNGMSRVVVERHAPRSARRSAFRVTAFDAYLDTVATVSVPFTPVRLARRIVESARSARLDQMTATSRQPMPASLRQAISEALTAPEFFPPVEWVALGVDGVVWLRMAPTGEDDARWYALDVSRKQHRVVRSPPGVSIVEASGPVVWSVEFGPNDEPQLVRYRLTAAP